MLASSNDIDNEPIFRAYESALKELESVVGSEPSNSAGISEKLLDILLVRDRVQKEFVSNVSPGSANLGLKLNELDRQFKINCRTINQKLKSKTRIDILVFLEEFKDLMEITSKDWWWNPEIYSGFVNRLSPLWKFLSCFFLGWSFVILCNMIYGLTNGSFTLEWTSNLIALVGSILGGLGLQSVLTDSNKNIILILWKNIKKTIQPTFHDVYKSRLYRIREIVPLILSFIAFLFFFIAYKIIPNYINNDAVENFKNSGLASEDTIAKIKRAVMLNPLDPTLRKNLADAYNYSYDYDNAIKEYKALLPDFEAVKSLILLSIEGNMDTEELTSKDTKANTKESINNKKDSIGENKNTKVDSIKYKSKSYDKYIAYLIYVMQISYNSYCIKFEKEVKQGKEEKCISLNSKDYLRMSKIKNSDEFMRNTFNFFETRGRARIYQGQYSKAKEDLMKSSTIAEIMLKKYSKTQKDIEWRTMKVRISCFLTQLPVSVLSETERNNFKRSCDGYSPSSLYEWTEWTPELDFLSDPDLTKNN